MYRLLGVWTKKLPRICLAVICAVQSILVYIFTLGTCSPIYTTDVILPYLKKHSKVLLAIGVAGFFLVIIITLDRVSITTMPYCDNSTSSTQHTEYNCCFDMDSLGAVNLDLSPKTLASIEAENQNVELGGRWSASGCSTGQEVAILISYRDRWEHLKILLHRLHPMLQRQKASYQVFVIEQVGNDTFNKGRLYNIGIQESLKHQSFNCFIFHDVDMIPENDKNIYYCDDHLRHFSPALKKWNYKVPYATIAGGAVALSLNNTILINGFSNMYWGWGGEDDDLAERALESGMLISRPPLYIGRYTMATHAQRSRSDTARSNLRAWKTRWRADGLNSLYQTNYKIIKTQKHALYTWFLVDVGTHP